MMGNFYLPGWMLQVMQITLLKVISTDNLSSSLDGNPRKIISKRVNPDNEQSYTLFFYTGDELFLYIEGTNDRFSTNTVFAAVVFDGSLTTNNRSKIYLSGSLDVTSGESINSIANNASDLTIGVMNEGYGTGRHLAGDLAECIVYNTPLNTAQRIIVENYLGAKYAISISNDKYAYESIHGNDVAGIGHEDAGNYHTKARSSIAELSNPADLENSEYLLFGHNGLNLSAENNDIPVGVISRLNRVWRFDETGGDVGNITILFDVSSFSKNFGNDL
jgi:hypothetical protein